MFLNKGAKNHLSLETDVFSFPILYNYFQISRLALTKDCTPLTKAGKDNRFCDNSKSRQRDTGLHDVVAFNFVLLPFDFI